MSIGADKKPALSFCRFIGLFLLCTTLPACVNQTIKSTSVPSINTPNVQVGESLLLDASIAIFDPGLEDYDEDSLIYPEVRKAEARYMPTLLSESMQNSGAWGAVRVVPTKEQISDLMVTGKILYSDGEKLNLHIIATDSRDVIWLNKKYISHASRYAYSTTTREKRDPFLAVYNTIANDLLHSLETLKEKDRKNIRLVTELLFAQSFSPDAYKGYLEKNRTGRKLVMRLPAEGDPMLERIRTIRDRDNAFIDTMQGHYGSFNNEMLDPYQEWRKLSYEEATALQELKAESTRRLIAGGVALIAGIAAASSGNSTASRTAGNVAILGGGYLLKSGLEKRNEAEIHVQALEELGQSLEAEITPQVIELQDRTVMLSGNVEDQYAQWREILGDIYRAEVGELEETQSTLVDTIEPPH
ncbi:MAG: hypothetical protein ACI8QT_001001 [Halioglobus sp.]